MRRALAAVALVGAGMLGVTAPAVAAPQSTAAPAAVPAAVLDVDDFEFARMDVEYELGRDGSGRSTLRTVEHLVAVFPAIDQNRGIKRAIPRIFDGHSTRIEIISVTDEAGTPREYVTGTDGDFLLVTIAVPPGQYVHGEQHYVIEYTQRDVTRYFPNTDDDEFYWDVNGTGWAQPFGEVTATLRVDAELADLVTETACYRGPEGSTERCAAAYSEGLLTIVEQGLWPHQNVTLVVAFPSGTFQPAPFNLFDHSPWQGIVSVGAILLAGLIAIASRGLLIRDATGRGLVIAQYEPPPGMTLPLAAEIVGRRGRAFAATIVDLAVRRRLRIVERDGSWGRKEFGLLRLASDDSGLDPTERRLLDAIFLGGTSAVSSSLLQMFGIVPQTPGPEGVRWLARNDTFLGRHVLATRKEMQQFAVSAGLRRTPPRWPTVVVVLLSVLAFLLLLLLVLTDQSELGMVFAVLGMTLVPWVAIGAVALVAGKKPLTEKGATLKEELDGLKEFISWAEADRLRMLQSVSGAERRPLDTARVVTLYEQLLPYAILFGQEKQWSEELSRYYGTESPDWYSGATPGFHAATFASSIGSFASSTSSSYSGSSSSSSSGGSGGGGSSGGGGGGGGGGGV